MFAIKKCCLIQKFPYKTRLLKITIFFVVSDCDLSKTGIFKLLENGLFDYKDGYKIKFSAKNKATGEKLQNKGKLLKSVSKMTHKKEGTFSDGWVTCNKNKIKKSALIRCYADGTVEIDGKTGRKSFLIHYCCRKRFLNLFQFEKFSRTNLTVNKLRNVTNVNFRPLVLGFSFQFDHKQAPSLLITSS